MLRDYNIDTSNDNEFCCCSDMDTKSMYERKLLNIVSICLFLFYSQNKKCRKVVENVGRINLLYFKTV